ncbi:hypothetical protein D9758_005401 [Tetrapyrgos nigripes]|uniref:Asl1-like glycosyl hydrolase catalytic domain-containing protein n=1 Tax=Tetrapyrgos nigripes TaxID=182062 RepID=A0A8H5GHS7_9AGAR|nr:hypothetical protein D9758_005401 [Tetrapyrgos nigripes]
MTLSFRALSNALILLTTLCSLSAVTEAANAKRGIAYALDLAQNGDAGKVANTQISWAYDWQAFAIDSLPAGIELVPMQHDANGINDFQNTVKNLGAKVALGFNEPDVAAQAHLEPADAANLWKQGIQPLAGAGVRLGSPAVSSSPAPAGTAWLQAFLSACDGCTVDFIAIHWYGDGADNFIAYVQDVHNQFPNKNIWVTEFASTSTDPAAVQAFLDQTINWLDGQAFVERYSWFVYGRSATNGLISNLLDGSGNLNALGNAYVN